MKENLDHIMNLERQNRFANPSAVFCTKTVQHVQCLYLNRTLFKRCYLHTGQDLQKFKYIRNHIETVGSGLETGTPLFH
jgi:hypothetical protein